MNLDNLPVGWVSTTLEVISSKITDGSHNPPKPSSEGKPMISAKNIVNGNILFDEGYRLISEDSFEIEARRTKIQPNDILLTIVGALGRSAIVPNNIQEFTLQRSVAVLNSSYCDTKFLKYSLDAPATQYYIVNNAKGTAQKGIYLNQLKQLPIAIAPLAEQQEIVRQLDVMLAQVEQIKARLDAIPAILKKFRQSVLESSFRNLSKVRKVFLKDLVLSIDQGWSPKCLNTPASEKQWGIIKTSAIQSLYFDANENKELPSLLEPREALTLKSGDVLITRAGPRSRCGVSCIVDKNYDNLMICDKVYRVRCDSKKILADYLNLYLNSLTGLSLIEKMKTGSSESGMNLTQSKFRDLQIPLINLEQQIAFASDIKFFFLLANQIEEENRSAQKRVNLLTQSILAKAFSGELTAEWREQHQELITGVNSAEALLVKIQAKREVSKPAKKTRKKSEA